MKDWQRIRRARTDITDYVIHFTKDRKGKAGSEPQPAEKVFCEILNEGFIRPTFARITKKRTGTESNTVRGPNPAVCLTEQPLSAVIKTRSCTTGRYSGFGIAYHKYALFRQGGRPVIYGPEEMMGRLLLPHEAGYENEKDIYSGGLPAELQYLWVRYNPTVNNWDKYPVDFTWEREWRYKCSDPGLPVYLHQYGGIFGQTPIGAFVVEQDVHIKKVDDIIKAKINAGQSDMWSFMRPKIFSLETVDRKLKAGDERYARIETYPD